MARGRLPMRKLKKVLGYHFDEGPQCAVDCESLRSVASLGVRDTLRYVAHHGTGNG